MTTSLVSLLEKDRLETALPDKKPLYTDAEARAEAERCLYCSDAPCIKACPTEIDIPTFIKKIASGNVRGAARTIFKQNLLGYSCSRVCPVEVLCSGDCVYTGWHRDPIQIGRLQRYATESTTRTATRDGEKPLMSRKSPRVSGVSGKKVALVGAGPASLACAGTLALRGHKAVVFEKRSLPGGLNTNGIAPYKLPSKDALREVEWVKALGVEIRTGAAIGAGGGASITGKSLIDEYDAVFIGVGLGEDTKLGIAGEDGPGVVGATAWIEQMKLAKAPGAGGGEARKLGRIVVVGGGNTAIDVARECALLGARDVTMVYRRSQEAMSGYAHEMNNARKEGVRLVTSTVPVEVLRDATGKLRALRVQATENGKPIAGTDSEIPCDFVAVAIGQSKLRSIAAEFTGVVVDAKGCIVADPKTCVTGNPKVYSGGDCINGGKEVVNAAADGRNAARAMDAGWSGGASGGACHASGGK